MQHIAQFTEGVLDGKEPLTEFASEGMGKECSRGAHHKGVAGDISQELSTFV